MLKPGFKGPDPYQRPRDNSITPTVQDNKDGIYDYKVKRLLDRKVLKQRSRGKKTIVKYLMK